MGLFWSLALSTFSTPIVPIGTGSSTEEFEATKSKEESVCKFNPIIFSALLIIYV